MGFCKDYSQSDLERINIEQILNRRHLQTTRRNFNISSTQVTLLDTLKMCVKKLATTMVAIALAIIAWSNLFFSTLIYMLTQLLLKVLATS